MSVALDRNLDDEFGQHAEARENARRWARELLARPGWLILDTETTGLDDDAEICQLGVLAHDGAVVLDSYVRPTCPIPADVTRIHGITDAMVADAPSFSYFLPTLAEVVGEGRRVVSYNAAFDARMLHQSARRHGLDVQRWSWHCAMEMYAEYVGQWSSYHGSYRFQKLPPAPGVTGHTAIGDCRSTLALIRRMAGVDEN